MLLNLLLGTVCHLIYWLYICFLFYIFIIIPAEWSHVPKSICKLGT